jgi:hypothetical protein
MSVCSDIADYVWLTSDEAAAWLRTVAVSDDPLHVMLARLRRQVSTERAHLLIEQADLRRRAIGKFSMAEQMFFTRTALEQATDEHIAHYKAFRIAVRRAGRDHAKRGAGTRSAVPIADLCCGIGGDLLAFAAQGDAIAVDSNPILIHFATENVRAVCPTARVELRTANVLDFDIADVAAWHMDPDRRAGGRRTTSLASCRPNQSEIEQLLQRSPHAAIKLAPATKIPAKWADRCELEWISRGGVCRQLIAWHGDLALAPGQHRATLIPSNSIERDHSSTACGLATRSLVGRSDQPLPIAAQPDDYVFDIDPAVLAARLTGALAAEHCLSALDEGPTYLTGPTRITDPAIAGFHVNEVLPLRLRTLAKYLRGHGIGQLEIKKRGVDFEPEQLRRQLKLRGDNSATLLITRLNKRPTAIVAQRA